MSQIIEFTSNHPYLMTALFVTVFLIVKSELDSRFSGISQLNPADAVRLLNQDDTLLLDVRESSEYDSGHIKDAVHIPLSSLKDRLDELDKYKDKPVLVYCRSGHRSYQACKTLKKAGFEHPNNLAGGVMNWSSSNLPLTRK